MRRLILPGLVVAAGLALIGLLAAGVLRQGDSSSLDQQIARGLRPNAPQSGVALPLLGSRATLSLRGLRGKVVLLNVFASWCDPCKTEAPLLVQAQRRISAHGGTVLGVTYLDISSDTERFDRRYGVTYPVMRDVDGSFVRAFGSTGIPETFLIDRRGRITAIRRFQLDAAWLDRQLAPLLTGA